MLTCDDYITPGSLREAFTAMEAHHGRYRVVAGATDTLPWAREGRAGNVHIPALIDVAKIPELREISVSDARVRLGAATPIQRFLDDPSLVRALPAMPRCAVWFADDQIRAQATIGGNIVNASPAADATPCLIAHEAELELAKNVGGKITHRRVRLEQFVTGPNQTALQDGELLIAVECNALARIWRQLRKGRPPSFFGDFPGVSGGAAQARPAGADNRGCAPGDCRHRPEAAASRRRRKIPLRWAVNAERLEQAADMPVSLVASRTRQEYRREVVRGFVLRGLINAAHRAGADLQTLAPELEAAYA